MFVARVDRSPQGRKKLVAERAAFFALMAEGYGSSEACKIVGVNRATGTRWLYGRRDRPPRVAAPPARPAVSDRFLSPQERIVIADLRRAGRPVRSIAAGLGRSPSTISRELRRNAEPGSGEYRPHAAQARAEARRARPKPGKIASCPELAALIQGMLARRCSPEQISRRLRRDHPGRPELHVTHETIYQALYVQGRGELRRELARALRTGRAVRKPRRRGDQRQSRFPHPMVMISQRPAEADDRAVPGHWEGDLILGAGCQSAIGTLVERTTRYVLLVHLGRSHTADRVRDALAAAITTLPAHLRRSLTWDQGREMSSHAGFTIATGVPVYFCDPHSPWQRGSNENTNGLLRQYFPKGTNLAVHTPADLAAVAAELNGRPRKTLDWDTPAERLAKLLSQTS
jgi:IS30 family transposase